MRSSTKIDRQLQQVSAITVAALGRVALAATEITAGWFNTLYRVQLEDGRQVVLDLAPAPGCPVMRYERHLLAAEVQVLGVLARCGVPVPQVLAHRKAYAGLAHEHFLMSVVPGGIPRGRSPRSRVAG